MYNIFKILTYLGVFLTSVTLLNLILKKKSRLQSWLLTSLFGAYFVINIVTRSDQANFYYKCSSFCIKVLRSYVKRPKFIPEFPILQSQNLLLAHQISNWIGFILFIRVVTKRITKSPIKFTTKPRHQLQGASAFVCQQCKLVHPGLSFSKAENECLLDYNHDCPFVGRAVWFGNTVVFTIMNFFTIIGSSTHIIVVIKSYKVIYDYYKNLLEARWIHLFGVTLSNLSDQDAMQLVLIFMDLMVVFPALTQAVMQTVNSFKEFGDIERTDLEIMGQSVAKGDVVMTYYDDRYYFYSADGYKNLEDVQKQKLVAIEQKEGEKILIDASKSWSLPKARAMLWQ